MYMLDGQLAVYKHLPVPLFISGDIKAMYAVKPAIKALMAAHLDNLTADAKLYR